MAGEICFFIAIFVFAGSAGLASLLRSGSDLTAIKALTCLLNSGLAGLAVAFFWYHTYKENVYTLMGISIIVGLGGNSAIDFLLELWRKSGLTIKGKGDD